MDQEASCLLCSRAKMTSSWLGFPLCSSALLSALLCPSSDRQGVQQSTVRATPSCICSSSRTWSRECPCAAEFKQRCRIQLCWHHWPGLVMGWAVNQLLFRSWSHVDPQSLGWVSHWNVGGKRSHQGNTKNADGS